MAQVRMGRERQRPMVSRARMDGGSFESSEGARRDPAARQDKQCGAEEIEWYSIQTRFANTRSHYIRENLSNHVFGCKSSRIIVTELMSYNSATCKSQKSL